MTTRRIVLLLILGLLFVLALWSGVWGLFLWQNLSLLEQQKTTAVEHLTKRDIPAFQRDLQEMDRTLHASNRDLLFLRFLSWIPFVQTEYAALATTLDRADLVLEGATIGSQVFSDAQRTLPPSASLGNLSPETIASLQRLHQAYRPRIQQLHQNAQTLLKEDVLHSRISKLQSVQEQLNTLLTTVDRVAGVWAESGEQIFSLAGVGKERFYLLLLQNADELRPGGGVISMYGLLSVRDGRLTGAEVRHVQNIYPLGPTPPVPAPGPLAVHVWPTENLPNVNWSAEPAHWLQRSLELWDIVGDRDVDGVVVIGTPLLKDLVDLYGPIELPGVAEPLRAENVVTVLDAVTIREYEQQFGGPESYAVVQQLINAILERVQATTVDRLPALATVLRDAVRGRDLYVFPRDLQERAALVTSGMDPSLPVPLSDELFVVDANLGSAKADAILARTLQYDVNLRDPRAPRGQVRVDYDYTQAKPDERTWPYQGYLRLLVPQGTRSSESDRPGTAPTVEEAGRLVLGRDVTLNFGQKTTQEFSFLLAPAVRDGAYSGRYALTLRKQGGLEVPFTVRVGLPADWKDAQIEVTDGTTRRTESGVIEWTGTLKRDSVLTVTKR